MCVTFCIALLTIDILDQQTIKLVEQVMGESGKKNSWKEI